MAETDTPGRWATLLEALLRGIIHALSNRAAGVLALAEIPPAEHDAESLGMLPHEGRRMQELLRLVKLLPAEPAAVPAALVADEVMADALAIMMLHPSGRELTWHVAESRAAQPVRVERWVLLRALLLLMDAARERAAAGGIRAVELRLSDSADSAAAVVALSVADADRSRLPAEAIGDPYLASLVQRLGGTLFAGHELVLTIPTLAARRGTGNRES